MESAKRAGLIDGMSRSLAGVGVVAGVLLAGLIDFFTGAELRVYPLYFLPLALAAWHLGRAGAIAATVFATATWVISNRLAGLSYSTTQVWVVNTMAQAAAFGTVSGLMLWARNLLEREKVLSRIDGLTGLANARAFYDALTAACISCRRYGRPLTLAYIDIDNFKCVNDSHGHPRGDALLCHVATIFREELREADVSARIGGDEFVVCLPETSDAQARIVLERLRAAFAGALPTESCSVSASIGAVTWAVPPTSVDRMISVADDLMYQAKRNGKNMVALIAT